MSVAFLRRFKFLWVCAYVITAFVFPNLSLAQFAGIGALLNPEGSRLFPQSVLFPRHPGKPDPRWRSFSWFYTDRVADSSRYRLYFYEEEEWAARFVMPRIRKQIGELSKTFAWSPARPFSYLLFTSSREFRQANIFFITEGVQGITSTQEATMAIPYWGEAQTFDHISKHELVHQFQVQKINQLAQGYAMERMILIPLWFIEGMAEYMSLDGMDAESRVYLRDLLANPDPDRGYKIPKFFEEGTPGFVNTYKVGQAKIDFLELKYGRGTAQRILENASRSLGSAGATGTLFSQFVAFELKESEAAIEESWQSYLRLTFNPEMERMTQTAADFEQLKEAGDTLDYYDVSPDGALLATRQVDPLKGITSIQLYDLRNKSKRYQVAEDNKPGLLSLYFMQAPLLTISDHWIAYVVETTSGPEIEAREIGREKDSLYLGRKLRLKLHEFKMREVLSITFSPDGRSTAIVGLNGKGWANVYAIDGFPGAGRFSTRPLTSGYYSWRTLSWGEHGILAASDKTENGKYAIFRIDPKTGSSELLADSNENLLAPIALNDGVIYQSWTNGSPQIEKWKPGSRVRVTNVKSGMYYPKYRQNTLYSLIFHQGRYRLYRLPPEKQLATILPGSGPVSAGRPWVASLDPLAPGQFTAYQPFSRSRGGGIRVENLAGFFASGGFFGAAGSFSDLMRNYSVSASVMVLGDVDSTSAELFLTSQKGRATWTLGTYLTVQSRLDTLFSDGEIETYLHREFGVLGAIQYPLGAFSYIDAELRAGGVKRTDFSNLDLESVWEQGNPGTEFMVAPMFRLGYDRILYEAFSGPLQGFGALVESDTSWFPGRSDITQRFRLDVAQYWHIAGRAVLALNGMGAIAIGDRFRNSFLISSDDILRAYPFGDDRLYGNYLLAGKAEFRFPIGSLFGFPPLRGLAAYDLGSIWVHPGQLGQRVTSSYTGGLTLNLPPISLNFMLSAPGRTAPGPVDDLVAHFTLRYLYI